MKRGDAAQILFLLGESVVLLLSGGLLYVVISRLGGPEMLGEYSLVIAWVTLFQIFGTLGIPEYLLREMGRYGESSAAIFTHGLMFALAGSLLAVLAIMAVAVFTDYGDSVRISMLVACLAVIPISIAQVCRSGFLVKKKMQSFLLVVSIESIIFTTASLASIFSGGGIPQIFAVFALSKTISALLSLYLFRRNVMTFSLHVDRGLARSIRGSVAAFGLNNVLGTTTTRMSILMLSVWGTSEMMGHYAAANKILEIMIILPSIFGQLAMPRIARRFAARNTVDLDHFKPMFFAVFSVVLPAGVGVIVFADTIFPFIFGPDFTNAIWALRLLMLFYLLEAADVLMSVILKCARRPATDAYAFASNPCANLVLGVLLIPLWGATGAATARLGGGIASSVIRYSIIARLFGALGWRTIFLMPLLIAGMIGLGAVMSQRWIGVLGSMVLYGLIGALVLFPIIKKATRSLADD